MGSVRLGLLILWLLAMAGQALSTGEIQISSFSNLVIAPFFIVNFPAGTQVAIGVGDLFDSGINDTFTTAASCGLPCVANSNCLVGTTPTGANPPTSQRQLSTPNVIQPTDTTLPSHMGSGSSHSNLAPIGGGTAGGVITLLLIGLRLWYSWRRRQPSNTVLPTTTPMFGAHKGMATIGGTAGPIPVTGGVSTQNSVLSQLGYQTNIYDPDKVETSMGGTSPPPMPTDGPTISEVPYGQNRAPQTMLVATPVPIMPIPSHQVHSWSSTGGVDGGTRMTTNTDLDSKTVMSWGPPSSQAVSSSASPFITPPLREQEREQRLCMLESRMAMDMALPPYNDKD
ncbi:hypothetical protein DFH09DRAFT_1116848 [Mycena vulgaris]|nr:hypothetical protein DFH09DRAFT_1116848 [Mycena vulgaris]